MNIFKVLASGRKSFQEETASAVLLWFLNHTMDHGLGHAFLKKFIQQVADKVDSKELQDESENLKAYFRGEDYNQSNLWFVLEFRVDNAYIDIVLFSKNWVIAIENKIYSESVTENQIKEEYNGLVDKLEERRKEGMISKIPPITMIYLVPHSERAEDDEIPLELESELHKLKLSSVRNDNKLIVTWQENKINKVPSIFSMIEEILKDEMKGNIDPIPVYTKDTLKAFKMFIENSFEGYEYNGNTNNSGSKNPLTEHTWSIDSIRNSKSIEYVGVKGGIKGLLKMSNKEINDHAFQSTSQNMSRKHSWIEKDLFLKIVDWKVNKIKNTINWDGMKLDAESIYKIAQDYKSIRIGIRGGESGLKRLNPEQIRKKSWQINSDKNSKEWIDAETFVNILNEKKVF